MLKLYKRIKTHLNLLTCQSWNTITNQPKILQKYSFSDARVLIVPFFFWFQHPICCLEHCVLLAGRADGEAEISCVTFPLIYEMVFIKSEPDCQLMHRLGQIHRPAAAFPIHTMWEQGGPFLLILWKYFFLYHSSTNLYWNYHYQVFLPHYC